MNLKPNILTTIIFVDLLIIYTFVSLIFSYVFSINNIYWFKAICGGVSSNGRILLMRICNYEVNYLPFLFLIPLYFLSIILAKFLQKYIKIVISLSLLFIVFIIILFEKILGVSIRSFIIHGQL